MTFSPLIKIDVDAVLNPVVIANHYEHIIDEVVESEQFRFAAMVDLTAEYFESHLRYLFSIPYTELSREQTASIYFSVILFLTKYPVEASAVMKMHDTSKFIWLPRIVEHFRTSFQPICHNHVPLVTFEPIPKRPELDFSLYNIPMPTQKQESPNV